MQKKYLQPQTILPLQFLNLTVELLGISCDCDSR